MGALGVLVGEELPISWIALLARFRLPLIFVCVSLPPPILLFPGRGGVQGVVGELGLLPTCAIKHS